MAKATRVHTAGEAGAASLVRHMKLNPKHKAVLLLLTHVGSIGFS